MTGVVLGREGSTYRVHAEAGEVIAVLRGRLKHEDSDRVVAGDKVELEQDAVGERAAITAILPRRSVLARRAMRGAGGGHRAQPLAANVDQVVVVTAARDPDANPRMLDRFLVVAESNRLPAVVILNKIELNPEALGQLTRRLAPAGYQVLPVSVKAAQNLAAVRNLLRGRTSVLTGDSGVGKSSLINALEPGLALRIGAVSERAGTGRHTTRSALLIPLERSPGMGAGTYVVDTPGLREVAAWGLDPDTLGACFPEFLPFLDRCRFDNCRHLAEPDCAVRAAALAGRFDPDRLGSYERIFEEVNVPSWSTGRRRAR
ncbi:MAG TPA: ribosome small subunit-dependent GTPase A [Gemmatimonadales bacterium]|nr:ribosome small subunit-dependent GTPase A [Gemmatimonadales bacterium]